MSEKLLNAETRPAVVTDLIGVVQDEVKGKRGLSGAAVKAGYGAATKVVPDLVPRAVGRMLPDFARALDPLWDDFSASGGTDFGAFLAGRGPEATDALLSVADAKIAASPREPLKKAYGLLRGRAGGYVEAALPRLGRTLQRHV